MNAPNAAIMPVSATISSMMNENVSDGGLAVVFANAPPASVIPIVASLTSHPVRVATDGTGQSRTKRDPDVAEGELRVDAGVALMSL